MRERLFSILFSRLFFAIAAMVSFSVQRATADVTRLRSGGYSISPHERPAVLKIFIAQFSCTASLIGPRLLITTAHCFKSQTDGYFFYRTKKYNFHIYSAPEYTIDSPQDVAFGVIERAVPNVEPYSLSRQKLESHKVISYGYGCSGTQLGVYYLSEKKDNGFDRTYIGNQSQNMSLCHGDSGGPVVAYQGDQLVLVGVNRAVINSIHASWVTMLAHDYVYDLLGNVLSKHSLDVCGVNTICKNPMTL